jgi:serine protease Do
VRDGDVVVELNGKAVDSPGALTRMVAPLAPKTQATLKLVRDGKEVVARLQVGQRPDGNPVAQPSKDEPAPGSPRSRSSTRRSRT